MRYEPVILTPRRNNHMWMRRAGGIIKSGTPEYFAAYKLYMQTCLKTLPYGIYFGASEIHQELPGFSVSLLEPTLRAEDVPLHTHENASFVFVVAGSYLSNADGAPRVCMAPTVIFNPAGTTHRDSFALANGRFLAVSISNQSLRIAADGTALPSAAT